MNYTLIKKLPSPEEIIQSCPLPAKGYAQVLQDRKEVKDIINGCDSRLLIIVGPCSAWPDSAVLAYAEKLQRLSEHIKNHLKLVMRVYIQKPRTTRGWTGPVNQPDPLAPPDIDAGIRYARQMMVRVIEQGLAIADEALFTHNAKGFMELLSWVAIGARSTEDQEHRIFASAIDCAVGMKNPTHGSLAIGINSVLAAQSPHVAVLDGAEVQTHGNPYAHLVLRGSNSEPNYSVENIREVQRLMSLQPIHNPAVIVDASHDNSMINGKKDFRLQPAVIEAVMESRQQFPEIKNLVKGFMVESFLKEGCQKINPDHPGAVDRSGLSITDRCLGWETTQTMLLNLTERLAKYA